MKFLYENTSSTYHEFDLLQARWNRLNNELDAFNMDYYNYKDSALKPTEDSYSPFITGPQVENKDKLPINSVLQK